MWSLQLYKAADCALESAGYKYEDSEAEGMGNLQRLVVLPAVLPFSPRITDSYSKSADRKPLVQYMMLPARKLKAGLIAKGSVSQSHGCLSLLPRDHPSEGCIGPFFHHCQ